MNAKIIISFLLFLLLGSACIKENRDDCKGRVSLNFSYLADGNQQVFNQYISQVDLYVFDAEQQFQFKQRLNEDQLNSLRTELSLSPGSYHIIGVGNLELKDEIHNLKQSESVRTDQVFIRHKSSTATTDGNPTGNDALYLGSVDLEVVAAQSNEITMHFDCSHINLMVEVKGVLNVGESTEIVPAYNEIGLVFTNLPTETNLFTGNVGGDLLDYVVTEMQYDATTKQLTSAMNVMRFENVESIGDIQLVVTNTQTGDVLETISIMDFVTENSISLQKQEVTIALSVVISINGDISIELPNWNIEDINPGM